MDWNNSNSAPDFHETIKGILIHINIQSKATSKITNIFYYHDQQHNKKYDNNDLEANINLANQNIGNEKLEDIIYLRDFNDVTEKIDRNDKDNNHDQNETVNETLMQVMISETPLERNTLN